MLNAILIKIVFTNSKYCIHKSNGSPLLLIIYQLLKFPPAAAMGSASAGAVDCASSRGGRA